MYYYPQLTNIRNAVNVYLQGKQSVQNLYFKCHFQSCKSLLF